VSIHKYTAMQKEWWETIPFWWFSVLLLTFLQLNFYFWGEPVICDTSAHRLIFAQSLPSPDHVAQKSLATHKERWEMILFWWFFRSSIHLFFNSIAIFGTNPRSVISQLTDWFVPVATAAWLHLLKKISDAKRMVRNRCILMIF
jgi:energy-coupling factor transporter transmembrane protein EcfT